MTELLTAALAVLVPAAYVAGRTRPGRHLTDWADREALLPAFTPWTIPAVLVLAVAFAALWIVHPIRTRTRLRTTRQEQTAHD